MFIGFKKGNGIQCVTFPEDLAKFMETFHEAKAKMNEEVADRFFEIKDFHDGKHYSIMIDLKEVNSIVCEESPVLETDKMSADELHNLDVVGNKE